MFGAVVGTYLLLKDYIVYWLTGQRRRGGLLHRATFTFYFDIYRKCYWEEMLDAIGITKGQLPFFAGSPVLWLEGLTKKKRLL